MNWERNSLGVRVVNHVIEIVENLQEYLPLTLRQIHYQLVAQNIPGYANSQAKYKQLSSWLYNARVDGLIPWASMVDLRDFPLWEWFNSPEWSARKAALMVIAARAEMAAIVK